MTIVNYSLGSRFRSSGSGGGRGGGALRLVPPSGGGAGQCSLRDGVVGRSGDEDNDIMITITLLTL